MTRTIICTVDEENHKLVEQTDGQSEDCHTGETAHFLRLIFLLPTDWTRKVRKKMQEKHKGYKFGRAYIYLHAERVEAKGRTGSDAGTGDGEE